MPVKALAAPTRLAGRWVLVRTRPHHNTNLPWQRRGEGRAMIRTPVRSNLHNEQVAGRDMLDGEDD
jgi:hypothetical protein